MISKDNYDIIVNNKVICRNVSQAHIRGVMYGLFLDVIRFMSEDALKELVTKTSEMIEEGVEKLTKRTALTELRIRRWCESKTREELLHHMSDWFLKAEGYSIYSGK